MEGKIFWIMADLIHVEGDTKAEIQSAKVDYAIIDENLIKFDWLPNSAFDGGFVQLINEHSDFFSGHGQISGSKEQSQVKAELFENSKGYLIQGSWIEGGYYYTWWAKFTKDAKQVRK